MFQLKEQYQTPQEQLSEMEIKREKGTDKISEEIIAKNFSNMGKAMLTQVHEP